MESSKAEYASLFDIGELIEFKLAGIPGIITAIIVEGPGAIVYRCAYMKDGRRYENTFTVDEIRAPNANGKGGKRTTARATIKTSGDTSENC